MCTVTKVAEEPLRGRLWSVWLWHKRFLDFLVNRGEYASQQPFLSETLSLFLLISLNISHNSYFTLTA